MVFEKDGDLLFSTNSGPILRNFEKRPVIVCAQRKAEKKVPTEDDLVQSNIDGGGSNVGTVTNRGSTFFCLRSKFAKNSKEYEFLTYKIRCIQLIQQNEIDRCKGIICKDMVPEWYSRKAIITSDMDDEKKQLYLNTVADRKPYFMIYIYDRLRKEYNTFIDNAKRKSLRLFRKDLEDLLSASEEDLTEDEKQFIADYELRIPVVDANDTVNRICHKVEKEFKSYVLKKKDEVKFDPSILKSGKPYSSRKFKEVKEVYTEYRCKLDEFVKSKGKKRIDRATSNEIMLIMKDEFKRKAESICQNEEALCDIVVDIAYSRENSRKFAWDICGAQIIRNLLKNNDNMISVPVQDDEGDIEFRGRRYRIERREYIEEPEEGDEITECSTYTKTTQEEYTDPITI